MPLTLLCWQTIRKGGGRCLASKARENPGNWQKYWKKKPKKEQIWVFRLTNARQSRIVNGGGFVLPA